MEDTEKYLIHAAITADGVVERSDVVGAIFGQTEGLLGDDLDLRDLQQSSKVGRIDVEIDSQNGQSFGTVTIASTLDRVKTAILAASLETITRVGPCRATVEVTDIEDVREAKRREVVERAKELLSDSFDESVMSSTEILDEVKESVRVEDISEYEGLPAGPNVAKSDAVIVVEGRADVLTLLRYGIKNAIGVEGTNVPDAVADLTQERTTTAFLDGDRGGELILRELAQVGNVDHVAFAPEGRSVEDLDRHEVFAALRNKDPIEAVATEARSPDADDPDETTDGETPDPPKGSPTTESAAPRSDPFDVAGGSFDDATDVTPLDDAGDPPEGSDVSFPADVDASDGHGAESDGTAGERTPDAPEEADGAGADTASEPDTAETGDESDTADTAGESQPTADADNAKAAETDESTATAAETGESTVNETDAQDSSAATAELTDEAAASNEADGSSGTDDADSTGRRSLADHVREVIDGERGTIRLLDDDLAAVAEEPAADAFDAIAETEPTPYAAVLDGEFTQRLLDIAAQRGVDHAIAATTGEFVKKPIGVRLRTADQLANSVVS